MAKRKRESAEDASHGTNGVKKSKADTITTSNSSSGPSQIHAQIIAGSYERILHGITASIPLKLLSSSNADVEDPSTEAKSSTETSEPIVTFTDTFLFNAHASSIRCLALSPPSASSSKVLLATGSTDAHINLYSLSTTPPPPPASPSRRPPSLNPSANTTASPNPHNKALGQLSPHTGAITALAFAARTKLLSGSADNAVVVTRTRDWAPLSALRAPAPTPSPDAAAVGVNAFAVHPSHKILLAVGRRERCLRLWNLVTGKKAGVLRFAGKVLEAVGEGRGASGEGRCVRWDEEGEEFVVGFEKGVAVFGMDCRVKGVMRLAGRAKVQQCRYVDGLDGVVAVSTDDGKICFYSTADLVGTDVVDGEKSQAESIPLCRLLAQLGGQEAGIIGRVKDFAILQIPSDEEDEETSSQCLVFTGYSDGAIRVWLLNLQELNSPQTSTNGTEADSTASDSEKPVINGSKDKTRLVGKLLGTYQTGNRITCLTAFIMSGEADGKPDADDTIGGEEDNSDSDSSD